MNASKHPSALPFNLDDLLNLRRIEDHRVERKATWDQPIKAAVVRTVCAFANDLLNLNGGYVILGVEDGPDGKPILPPRGLDEFNLDVIQREIIGACKSSISPEYLPLIFLETHGERSIIVIWAPGGDNRPYEAPAKDEKKGVYWVRSGSMTIAATGDLRRQLLELAKKNPFDDRRSLEAKLSDLSLPLVRQFLSDIRSHLAELDFAEEELYRRLKLTIRINDHEVPRNVALLFFNPDPARFFRGASIDVVQFGDDAGGDLIEERSFSGPLPDQIRSGLNFLNGLGGALINKIPGRAEADRTVPYPYMAMEEALVNAVYHRGYDGPPEPIKVYLFPDRMEITSYPGPMPGLALEHFRQKSFPPVPARNRRIGDFLKELRLAEGRGTGVPKIKRGMKENGSPEAIFDFDEGRTYFRVILPVHPRYRLIQALREAAYLWAIGDKSQALAHLERSLQDHPGEGAIASQLIEYAFAQDRPELAQRTFDAFDRHEPKSDPTLPAQTMARLLELWKKRNS